MPSIADQAASCAASAAAAKEQAKVLPWPMNPFPKGVRDGSATAKIREALEKRYPGLLEHHELMRASGKSRGAVSWGVRYLIALGEVRAVKSARNPLYLRYQYVPPERRNPGAEGK